MCSIAAGFVAPVLVGTRFGGAGLVAVEILAERVGGIATWHCWSLMMELIALSGRWSNNEDGAGGERRSVGGWLGCATALKIG